jgi:hypothetical protein
MTQPCCIYEEGLISGNPQDCSPRWQRRLPLQWRAQVAEPRSFRIHREHEMPARQVFGCDAAGAPCFHA